MYCKVLSYRKVFLIVVLCRCIFRGEDISETSGVWRLMLSVQCFAQLIDAHAAIVADKFSIIRSSVSSLTDSRNI